MENYEVSGRENGCSRFDGFKQSVVACAGAVVVSAVGLLLNNSDCFQEQSFHSRCPSRTGRRFVRSEIARNKTTAIGAYTLDNTKDLMISSGL
jgi:hypothetical protein